MKNDYITLYLTEKTTGNRFVLGQYIPLDGCDCDYACSHATKRWDPTDNMAEKMLLFTRRYGKGALFSFDHIGDFNTQDKRTMVVEETCQDKPVKYLTYKGGTITETDVPHIALR